MSIDEIVKDHIHQECLALETFIEHQMRTYPPRLWSKLKLEKFVYTEGTCIKTTWKLVLEES